MSIFLFLSDCSVKNSDFIKVLTWYLSITQKSIQNWGRKETRIALASSKDIWPDTAGVALVLENEKLRCLGWSNSIHPKMLTFIPCRERPFLQPHMSPLRVMSLIIHVQQLFGLETAHQRQLNSEFCSG